MSSTVLVGRTRVVVQEINAGRVEASRRSIEAHIRKAFTLSDHERVALIEAVCTAVDADGQDREREQRRPPRPLEVLRGEELHQAAAAIWQKHPKLTSAEVYQQLTETHRVGVTSGSFVGGGHARKARMLAFGTSGKPREMAPSRPARQTIEVTPRYLREPWEEEPVPTVSPEVTSAVTHQVPLSDPVPAVAAPIESARIVVEVGEDRIEARRQPDGRWAIEFEGTVPDAFARKLMGFLLQEVAA